MTALLLDTAAVAPRSAAAHRPARRAGGARACVDVSRSHLRLVAAAPVATPVSHLTWTPRGLAVLMACIGLVIGLMTTTLVVAFLGVSDAPLPQPVPVAAVLVDSGR